MATLLSDHLVPPHDIWDESGRYIDIRERHGHDLTDHQLMCLMDKFYETSSDRHVPYWNEREQPTIRRDLYNSRGDMGVTDGIEGKHRVCRPALGTEEGPHTSQKSESSASSQLPTGRRRWRHCLWPTSAARRRRVGWYNHLWLLVSRRPNTHHERIPRDGAIFLKECDNLGKDWITQKKRSEEPSIDKKWERKERDTNWTISFLTFAVREAQRHDFACCILPHRWERQRHHEVCCARRERGFVSEDHAWPRCRPIRLGCRRREGQQRE